MNEEDADREIDKYLKDTNIGPDTEFMSEYINKLGLETSASEDEEAVKTLKDMRDGAKNIAASFKRMGATKAMFLGAMEGVINTAGKDEPALDQAIMKGFINAVYSEAWNEMEKEMTDDIK